MQTCSHVETLLLNNMIPDKVMSGLCIVHTKAATVAEQAKAAVCGEGSGATSVLLLLRLIGKHALSEKGDSRHQLIIQRPHQGCLERPLEHLRGGNCIG